MTGGEIAAVVADLRAGRVVNAVPEDPGLLEHGLEVARNAEVVDATAIYESLVAKDDPVWIYEDHPCITPPWPAGAVCYLNEHGNVVVILTFTTEIAKRERRKLWVSQNDVDWADVRWLTTAPIFVGGRDGTGRACATTGPLYAFRNAIYSDGRPADLRWIQLSDALDASHWDTTQLVLLGALNFLACRNVALVEPGRPRAERRRIARTGVTVKVINVFPPGPTRRSGGKRAEPLGVPLTSVRGHFAHYGPQHNRGLLFGRLAGRFWIPQHAKGAPELGETKASYRLRPEPGRPRGS